MTRPAGTAPKERFTAWLWLILLVAIAVRFWRFEDSGFIHWDEHFFVSQARQLAANWSDGVKHLGWYGAPLLSLVMGLAMKIFGPSDGVAIAVSAVSGSLACVATGLLGQACLGKRAAVLGGLLLAVSPFAFIYSRIAIADSLFLLLFLMTLLFIWRLGHGGTLATASAGGVLAGLLTMTKFNGLYAVMLLAAWLGSLGLRSLVAGLRRGDGTEDVSLRRLTVVTFCWLLAYAATIAIFLPSIVPADGGLARMAEHFRGYGEGHTDARVIFAYLSGTNAATVVFACAVGMLVAVFRRTMGDLFLLLTAASFFAAVMRYLGYPRLGLPLAPLLVLFAAGAVDWLSGRARGRRGEILFAAGCVALIVPQFWMLIPVASLRTRGYADAAALVEREPPEVEIWSRTQPALYLYTSRPRSLECSPETAASLERDVPRLFVLDQVSTWSSVAPDLLARNTDRIVEEFHIRNPMYVELLLQPFTWDRWRNRHNPVPEYREIRFVRTKGALTMSPECSPGR
jgi:4-amino-4-deoxy-L-arabinose transferase-like glycosyltransferase